MPLSFETPQHATEARKRMMILKGDMRQIENQLSNRNRLDSDGKRLSVKEYWDWNARAKGALAFKQQEHEFLRVWLLEHSDVEKVLAEALCRLLETGHLPQMELIHCLEASGYFRKIHRIK